MDWSNHIDLAKFTIISLATLMVIQQLMLLKLNFRHQKQSVESLALERQHNAFLMQHVENMYEYRDDNRSDKTYPPLTNHQPNLFDGARNDSDEAQIERMRSGN